jgi:hypothetical protein
MATGNALPIPIGVMSRDRGTSIPRHLRLALETVLDCDLSTVRLRVEPRLTRIGAYACAQGEDVALAPAVYTLAPPARVAVLGHELAHVLQQRAGRVQSGADGPLVTDPRLEREAQRAGAHCAARLFPGSTEDPGLPLALRSAATATDAQALAPPIQFLRTSVQSFNDFVGAAWQYLGMPMAQQLSDVQNLRGLYAGAANYNLQYPPKASLYGVPLYRAMTTYIQSTHAHQIRLQTGNNWPDLTNDVATFAAYYTACANRQSLPLNVQAEKVPLRYLHVYPALPANGDWRIGLNVKPHSMAAAMTALAPLLDQFPDIDHMKFLGPGSASKADSVIVYLRRDEGRYPGLRDAIIRAVADLDLELRVGAMWNEIQEGVGEGGEPPAGSFTTYRCVVVYLAYGEYQKSVREPSFCGFRKFLDARMRLFGLDVNAPHRQGPLPRQDPAFANWWNAFNILHGAWQA